MDREYHMIAAIVGVMAVLTGLSLWFSAEENKRQTELIASGQCESQTEQFYQPQPTYICTARNADGFCLVQTPIQSEGYMQTLWRCDDGEEFWRRSE